MTKIRIIKSGTFTTVQDKGRWGYEGFGISVAGSMDDFASRVANILVGNPEDSAVLESTFLGPEIIFDCDEIISITGGNMSPRINGEPIPKWTSIKVKEGDILSFSPASSGFRSYISFSRGLDIPEIMASRSTFTRGKLGGYKGRKLENGDEINLGNGELSNTGSYLASSFIPLYGKEKEIRVIMGPQDDYFTKKGIETFLSSKYTISSQADRMGYRLNGPQIEHISGADIISDGIVFGSIQVPGHGFPIIMMADRATTGGYTKIATVITPDLSVLAQMRPGDSINFTAISLKEAHRLYREYENRFKEIKSIVKDNSFEFNEIRKFNLKIDKSNYKVDIIEMRGEIL
ncbi:biotin-dependent carboxyltransferase family protein [Tissierella sp.]|uniref:5-oxoprolinase subunit C family protein n=1 Tax=Tissierella sp. TaxID=41274 RepID=UPI00285CCF0C|nr:biotin-dependent carboxyltransferase family protein [Tissierella sp.]MDR7857516.1 biotin-dependent carboxyltransferase family protein [Tissierella sp.]